MLYDFADSLTFRRCQDRKFSDFVQVFLNKNCVVFDLCQFDKCLLLQLIGFLIT